MNFVIGTAGHVDHGKTCLVKALTGTDTDRLAEEKRRGLTIEPGFACLALSGGGQAAVIDVPGHERFLKNMLACAGGVDYVLLVIAADEGVMPQTREHLAILGLLGAEKGMAVITKRDLVEEKQLTKVKQETALFLADSFLAAAPVLTVSAATGQGIPELRQCLEQELASLKGQSEKRAAAGPFRLPVDRVFTREGFGTVVTGTLIQGTIEEGENFLVYPQGYAARVRGLQVQGRPVSRAFAGQRVAINLTNLKKEQLRRGQVLAPAGFLESSLLLDVRLVLLADARREIKSGSRLHLYHGAGAVLCRVILLEQDRLAPGKSCYAQLRLEEPLAAKRGDPFIIRFYSPLETLGGGRVLEPCPVRHKAGDASVLEGLKVKETGDEKARFLQFCRERGRGLAFGERAAQKLDLTWDAVACLAEELEREGRIFSLTKGVWLAKEALDSLARDLRRLLAEYHAARPLSLGFGGEGVRQQLFGCSKEMKKREKAALEGLWGLLADQGLIRREGELLALAEFSPACTPKQAALSRELLALFEEKGLESPWLEELYALRPPREKALCRQVLAALLASGRLVRISPRMLLSRRAYQEAALKAVRAFSQKPELTLADFRDLWGTSRKYALALLEYWDSQRITRKTGEGRILVGSLEKEAGRN